jgi:DNA-binding FrmR family transcriptional regulator
MEHHHHHSEEHIKEVSNRLARAIGHLQKVKRMVENDEDCSEVLIQLAAVKSAINNTGKIILKDHMDHCIVHAVEDNDLKMLEELSKAIDKFIK